jgi:hypothetical protein
MHRSHHIQSIIMVFIFEVLEWAMWRHYTNMGMDSSVEDEIKRNAGSRYLQYQSFHDEQKVRLQEPRKF